MGQTAGQTPNSSNFLWETPKEGKLGDPRRSKYTLNDLIRKYNIVLDVAALPENSCVPECITPQEDGLKVDWYKRIETIYSRLGEPVPHNVAGIINPPGYDQEQITPWMKRCVDLTKKYPFTMIGILPAYTDTPWYADYVWECAGADIYWVPGRIRFWEYGEPREGSPYFASMIVKWRYR